MIANEFQNLSGGERRGDLRQDAQLVHGTVASAARTLPFFPLSALRNAKQHFTEAGTRSAKAAARIKPSAASPAPHHCPARPAMLGFFKKILPGSGAAPAPANPGAPAPAAAAPPPAAAGANSSKSLFSFGGKVAYKNQQSAATAINREYDFLFKILLVGMSHLAHTRVNPPPSQATPEWVRVATSCVFAMTPISPSRTSRRSELILRSVLLR